MMTPIVQFNTGQGDEMKTVSVYVSNYGAVCDCIGKSFLHIQGRTYVYANIGICVQLDDASIGF